MSANALKLLGKHTTHIHHTWKAPAIGPLLAILPGFTEADARVDFDLLITDKDDDGDPEVYCKWDLPGTALDSGAEPVKVEIPLSIVFGPLADMISAALVAAGAPTPVVGAVKAVFVG